MGTKCVVFKYVSIYDRKKNDRIYGWKKKQEFY